MSKLLSVAGVCVILATAGYAFETVKQELAVLRQGVTMERPEHPRLEQSAYTDLSAAHVTFTNLNGYSVGQCMRGLVVPHGGGRKVTSVPVCTGEIKPRTTVSLEAPYPVGAVIEVCHDDHMKNLPDWSKCDFTLEEVP
jgi:hypothetical protein